MITVEELIDIPSPCSGAPLPFIISDDHNVVLIYYSPTKENNDRLCVLKFNRKAQYKFGMPNEEAFHGHPLQKFGVEKNSFFRIKNSPWITDLIKINSVHPYHKNEMFNTKQHIIISFHDNCFEIVCESYQSKLIEDKSFKEVTLLELNSFFDL